MEITESRSGEVALRLRSEGGRRHQREKSQARRETQGYEAGGEPTVAGEEVREAGRTQILQNLAGLGE